MKNRLLRALVAALVAGTLLLASTAPLIPPDTSFTTVSTGK
jgi:hypothetical protein